MSHHRRRPGSTQLQGKTSRRRAPRRASEISPLSFRQKSLSSLPCSQSHSPRFAARRCLSSPSGRTLEKNPLEVTRTTHGGHHTAQDMARWALLAGAGTVIALASISLGRGGLRTELAAVPLYSHPRRRQVCHCPTPHLTTMLPLDQQNERRSQAVMARQQRLEMLDYKENLPDKNPFEDFDKDYKAVRALLSYPLVRIATFNQTQACLPKSHRQATRCRVCTIEARPDWHEIFCSPRTHLAWRTRMCLTRQRKMRASRGHTASTSQRRASWTKCQTNIHSTSSRGGTRGTSGGGRASWTRSGSTTRLMMETQERRAMSWGSTRWGDPSRR
jgi:hypothetical protein